MLKRPEQLKSPEGEVVKPHRGALVWSPYRRRWLTIFTQHSGKTSLLGEIWYAEADGPLGPWGPAVKVLSHDDYTFYNPQIHPEFTPAGSSLLFFEGTYCTTFSGNQHPTPRYDYNQVLYRLDLDDPALRPAQSQPRVLPLGSLSPPGEGRGEGPAKTVAGGDFRTLGYRLRE